MTYSFRAQVAEVSQSIVPLLGIFNLNSKIFLMSTVFLCEVSGMFVKSSLSTDSNGSIEIKRQFVQIVRTDRFVSDKCVQSRSIRCFGITIEKQGGVVRVGKLTRV